MTIHKAYRIHKTCCTIYENYKLALTAHLWLHTCTCKVFIRELEQTLVVLTKGVFIVATLPSNRQFKSPISVPVTSINATALVGFDYRSARYATLVAAINTTRFDSRISEEFPFPVRRKRKSWICLDAWQCILYGKNTVTCYISPVRRHVQAIQLCMYRCTV